jgi:PKD repeat protein
MNEYTLQGVAIADGWLYSGNDGGYLFVLANKKSINIADFEVNSTSRTAPLIVQFLISQKEPCHGSGTSTDYFILNPVHEYTIPGRYTISFTVTTPNGADTLTMEIYIYVGDDWNPWNDPHSDDDCYIKIEEVIKAYNCWRFSNPAPETNAQVEIEDAIEMYNTWRFNRPM